MAFDPVTFTEVLNAKAPIGSLVRVVKDFNNPKYVATGAKFNSSDYPSLATQFAGGFQGDYVVEKPIEPILSGNAQLASNIGVSPVSWVAENTMNFMFTISTSGIVHHFRSVSMNPADGLTYVGRFILPGGSGSDTVPPQFSVSAAGDFMYASLPGRHYKYNLSDKSLSTFTRLLVGDSGANSLIFCDGGSTLLAMTTNTALSTAGNVRRSTDGGANWVAGGAIPNISAGAIRNRVAYANGTFVLVAASSTNNTSRSSDGGVSWTTTTNGSVGFYSVAWNAVSSMFVATPYNSGNAYTSTNGSTWTVGAAISAACDTIGATTTGAMIASGHSTGSNQSTFVSTTGASWSLRSGTAPFAANQSNNPLMQIHSSTAIGGYFMTFASGTGTYYYTYSSNAGSTWAAPTPMPSIDAQTTQFNPPVISSSGDKVILTEAFPTNTIGVYQKPPTNTWNYLLGSYNGTTWQKLSIQSNGDLVLWQDVLATPDNKFVAWGRLMNATATSQTVCTALSSDGVNWTYKSSPSINVAPSYMGSLSDGTIMMAPNGTNGSCSTSTDYGQTWSATKFMPQLSIAHGGFVAFKDKFITFYINQAPRYSTNAGVTWNTAQMSPLMTANPAAVARDANVVVVTMPNSSTFYYSYDGITWITGTLPSPMPGTGLGIINGWVMLPSGGGMMYRTADFKSWELIAIGEDAKYSTQQITNISSDPTNTMGSFHGSSSTNLAGYFLRAKTEVSNDRRIPFIQSDIPNTKWVIIAK